MFYRQLMEISFLPEALIYPTASLLQIHEVNDSEKLKLRKLKAYFNIRWIVQVTPQEMSIY